MRIKGIIKNFFLEKGYGFILYSENGIDNDAFFHISSVREEDSKSLVEGVEVEFTIGSGRDGRPAAKNVKIIKKPGNVYLPADTVKDISIFDIDNVSLRLNKAAYFDDNKFIYQLVPKGKDIRLNPGTYANIPFKDIITRHKEAIRQMQLITWKKDLAVDWRLVVGLGGASVYETSITLHHIYGVPYLPASAVKGVTRNMVIAEHFDNIEGNKASGALGDPGFCQIFGSPENSVLGARQGLVRFFDAFPVSSPTLCLDVMNPHFGPYYSDKNNKTPPADYHNPIPVTFLTVEEISFTICAGIKPEDNVPIDNGMFTGKTPIEIVAEWIEKALKEHGIGAKTAVGYGYFNG